MHVAACSGGRLHAMACVSHDGDGTAYPVWQAQGRRRNGGDGEGAVRFETRGMCLKFWCRLPVREIWHPIKPQVMGTANRAPQKQGAQISNTWAGFRSERGSRRPRLSFPKTHGCSRRTRGAPHTRQLPPYCSLRKSASRPSDRGRPRTTAWPFGGVPSTLGKRLRHYPLTHAALLAS